MDTDIRLAFSHNSTLAKGAPAWGDVDKSKLPTVAFADRGERKYPHHWVKNGGAPNKDGQYTTGTMFLHEGGLSAAWGAAHGARSGKDANSGVVAHLRKHYAALGIKKASVDGREYDVTEFDQQLLASGDLTPEDLTISPGEAAHRLLGGCDCM